MQPICSASHVPVPPTLEDLPAEIKINVLFFLNAHSLTHGINLADKYWYNLSKDFQVWKSQAMKCYPDSFQARIEMKYERDKNYLKLFLDFSLHWKHLLNNNRSKKLKRFTKSEKRAVFSSYPCFSGNQILVGCQDKIIRIWNAASRKCKMILSGCHESSVKLVIAYDNFIRSWSDDAIGLWNALDGTLIAKRENTYGKIHRCVFKNYHVSISKETHLIKIVDLKEYKQFISTEFAAEILGFDILNTILIAIDAKGMIFVWDVVAKKLLQKLSGGAPTSLINVHADDLESAYVSSVKIYGDYVINSSGDQEIQIWNFRTGEKIGSLDGHVDEVIQIDVVGDKLISASKDFTLRIWDLSHLTEIHDTVNILKGHNARINAFAVFDNRIASLSCDGNICFWDIDTGSLIGTRINLGKTYHPYTYIKFSNQKVFVGNRSHLRILS